MKINRAIGLILFLVIAKFILSDVVSATSRAIVATMGTVETAGETATLKMIETR